MLKILKIDIMGLWVLCLKTFFKLSFIKVLKNIKNIILMFSGKYYYYLNLIFFEFLMYSRENKKEKLNTFSIFSFFFLFFRTKNSFKKL